MKILFLLTQSLESPSGLGRYGPLARQIAARGHAVSIAALHPDWEALQQKQFVDAGVHIHYVAQMHVRKTGSQKIYFSPLQLLWISFLAFIRLTIAAWQSDADIIQLGKPHPFNVLAARLAARGRPIYVDCDDYEAETNRFSGNWQKKIVRYFEDSPVHFARGLTVNTRFTAARYQKLGMAAEKIIFVPNGVEQSRFTPPYATAALRKQWQIEPKAPLILYVGTLGLTSHPVDLLLNAFAELQLHLPEARLLLVGGGEDFHSLQELAKQLDLTDKAIFTGRVQPHEVAAYLAAATVTVDPVHDDLTARARCPLKLVESLAVGVPILTSDVGDRRELLGDGKFGILVPAGNAAALAAGLKQLLENPAQLTRLREQIHTLPKQLYWQELTEIFLQIYDI